MKIDQNAAFSKNVADPSPLVSAKDSGNTNLVTTGVSASAGQAQSPSAATLLPSTKDDFDTARVTKIRTDISSGRYRVNTTKIADGLLSSVRDLLGSKAT